MKKILLVALAVSVLAGCRSRQTPQPAGELSVDSAQIVYNKEDLDIDLKYPIFGGTPVADSLNKAVGETIKAGLLTNPATDTLSITKFVAAFIASKDSLDRQLSSAVPYQLLSEWSLYRGHGIISLFIGRYTFTGGANGMQQNTFINFDEKSGERLSITDIFSDTTALRRTNREFFRRFMAADHELEDSMYLFVKIDSLPLPRNIGFDSAGVVMSYNLYEIAARAFGTARYTIPYPDVKMKTLIP